MSGIIKNIKHGKHNFTMLSCIIFMFLNYASAQDLHFSQFYNSPLTCNPANTGFMPDVDYRVGGNYRNQWATIPVPYKTSSFFADAQVAKDKFYNGWFGVGAVLLRDEAGSGALQSNKVYASVAYHQLVGEANLLSVGFQGGMVQKSINPTKLTFDNQWNGKFFDINAPTGETFATTAIRYFDLNVGINYAAFPTDESYLNFGFSVQHLNKPKETFFKPTSNYDNKLAQRYTAFFNGSFKLNDQVIVNPQAYISYMQKAYEVNVGGNLQYNLSGEGGQSQLIAGAYYRLSDAAIPMIGIKHKSVTATFTYDATVSKLGAFNGRRGANEISIIHNGIFVNSKGPKNMRCKSPSF